MPSSCKTGLKSVIYVCSVPVIGAGVCYSPSDFILSLLSKTLRTKLNKTVMLRLALYLCCALSAQQDSDGVH
jgi:hypothetical protein